MPIPDLGARRGAQRRPRLPQERAFAQTLRDRLSRRRKPPGSGEAAPSPVRPDRPLDLSGGAAAALEFGE